MYGFLCPTPQDPSLLISDISKQNAVGIDSISLVWDSLPCAHAYCVFLIEFFSYQALLLVIE